MSRAKRDVPTSLPVGPADESTATHSTTYRLPVVWQAEGRARETAVAVEAWVEAVLASPEPLGLSFVLSVGGPTPPTAGLVLRGFDADTTRCAAGLVREVTAALNAWQGLGDPEPWFDPAGYSNVFDLRVAAGPGRRVFSATSGPWTVARNQPSPTTMVIDLLGNDPNAAHPAVRCRVRVLGDGSVASMVATLVAADPPGPLRLEAVTRPACDDSLGIEMSLPLEMVAHLVSTPARLPGAWPTQPVVPFETLFEMVERGVPPHAAFFGGSGLGKTTALEHLVSRSIAAGHRVVVLCPHGDLARRAATVLRQAGVPFDAVDFAEQAPAARWNLCLPPPLVSPQQWAAELVNVLIAAWPDMPKEWTGPVWHRSMRTLLEVLTRDPRGPQPLTEVMAVAAPERSDIWRPALDAIDDRQLTTELRAVHTAIQKDSEGRYGIWLTSKLEPFVADERIRRVLGSPTGTFDLEGLRSGRSLVVSAPASALGEQGSTVLVATLLNQLWHRLRQHGDPTDVVDIYVDEIQRIPVATPVELLCEGRKYGVRLRVATQTPLLLDHRLREAIATNCGAIGTFRTGPREAAFLDPLFPTVLAGTLARLDRHWMALTDGERDLVGHTPPPLVEPHDNAALHEAHSRCHHEGPRLR